MTFVYLLLGLGFFASAAWLARALRRLGDSA
jgi:hypothetical protein